LRLRKVQSERYRDWNSKCPLCETDHAEDTSIEHLILVIMKEHNIKRLIMRCSKWNSDRDFMLKVIRKDWERYEPSIHLMIDRATVLNGINDNSDTLMPIWPESGRTLIQIKIIIARIALYLHGAKFSGKKVERRRLEILRIQKLKLRQD
jgi:hypothetical protein